MNDTIFQLSENNFIPLCDELAKRDKHLGQVLIDHGYPPLWNRPNTFESLVHIILEQQVSLASALAALKKLREKLIAVSPENFLLLDDDELRACYFSRQKALYTRELAGALVNKKITLDNLNVLPDDEVRTALIALKGIGHWTVDIYLIFILQRADIFPIGDLAALNSLKKIKKLSSDISRDEVMRVAGRWKPYRSVATMILWHHYLSVRKKT